MPAATGKNYAVKMNGTAPNPTGLTINNNVYFANGTGAVFGFFNCLDVPNLVAWRTAVGQDSAASRATRSTTTRPMPPPIFTSIRPTRR